MKKNYRHTFFVFILLTTSLMLFSSGKKPVGYGGENAFSGGQKKSFVRPRSARPSSGLQPPVLEKKIGQDGKLKIFVVAKDK